MEYNKKILSLCARIKDSSHVLTENGEILQLQRKFEEAQDFHQRALTIRKEYCSSDHANSLRHLGTILHIQEKFKEAYECFQEALAIHQKYYPSTHIDIAHCLVPCLSRTQLS